MLSTSAQGRPSMVVGGRVPGGRASVGSRARGKVSAGRVAACRFVVGVAAAGVLVSGCGSSSAPAPIVMPTPSGVASPVVSTSPTLDPAAMAKAEVLAVYRTFMDARNRSLNDPTKRPDRRLDQVSTGAAKNAVFSLAVYYRARGLAIHGSPTSTVSTFGPMLEGGRVAVFQDCLDSTSSFPIFAKSGKSALAPNQPRRVLIEVQAVKEGTSWLIRQWTPNRGKAC